MPCCKKPCRLSRHREPCRDSSSTQHLDENQHSDHDHLASHPQSIKQSSSKEHTSDKSLATDKHCTTTARNARKDALRGEESNTPLSSEEFTILSSGTAEGASITCDCGDSDIQSDVSMEERPIEKLRRHHRFNRAIVVSKDAVTAILEKIGMKEDTIYGSKVISDLGCTILFFKTSKLLSSAINAAAG